MTLTKRPTPKYQNIPLQTESLALHYFVQSTLKAAPEIGYNYQTYQSITY